MLLRQIEYFQSVIENGNFYEAAEQCHEELYHAMENGKVDLALNDQRRAFSSAYNNIVIL